MIVPIGGGGLISASRSRCTPAIPTTDHRRRIVWRSGDDAQRRRRRPGHARPCRLHHRRPARERVGEKTYQIVRDYVDELVTLPDEQIFEAVVWIMSHLKLVAEGAAAAPSARCCRVSSIFRQGRKSSAF